jgi:hypothetical protein
VRFLVGITCRQASSGENGHFFVFIQTGPGKDIIFPHLFTQELRLQ